MATSIEWTDVTDNIITAQGGGWWCRKISPGCLHCYAARINNSSYYGGNKKAYTGDAPPLLLRREFFDRWKRQKKAKRHFVASMTDVFGEWVPVEWALEMLDAMAAAPLQTFQVLTKRPGVARRYIAFDSKASGRNGFGIGEVSPTLRAMGHKLTHHNAGGQVAIAFDSTQITNPDNRCNPQPGDPCHPLAAGAHPPAVCFSARERADDGRGYERAPHVFEEGLSGTYVRRLTPRECERLQGFPDDYTLIPGWGDRPRKPTDRADTVDYLIATGFPPGEAELLADHPDGARYRALGNSKAVPVVRWIGARIDAVEALKLNDNNPATGSTPSDRA